MTTMKSLLCLYIYMVSFEVTPLTDKIKLTRSTASEQNNAFFIVEKSTDGIRYNEVATIKGAGNSTQLLSSYVDYAPGDGINYYRIKQVDFNNNYTYSEVKNASINTAAAYGLISVYPQPIHTSEN